MRTIIVGDIHGCLEEFDELLKTTEFKRGNDRLVLLGDLVDRGPDPVGVVRRARELKAESVLGNHEEKHLRWRRHEFKRRNHPGYRNPMKPFTGERLTEHLGYSEDDWAYIEAMPFTIDLGNWVAVHAGFEPGVHWTAQRADKMLRIRYAGPDGKMKPIHNDTDKPEGTDYWGKLCYEQINIAHGHMALSMEKPVFTSVEAFGRLWSRAALDTGCCFGGALSAMILRQGETRDPETVSIKAKGTYAQVWAGDDA